MAAKFLWKVGDRVLIRGEYYEVIARSYHDNQTGCNIPFYWLRSPDRDVFAKQADILVWNRTP